MLQEKITPGLQRLPGRGPPTPSSGLSPAHSQLLVVLVREVAEPGRVEEELRGVLQQEQDEAQAAQAAETPASLTVPERHPSPGGRASPHGPALRLPEPLPTPSPAVHRPCLGPLPPPVPPTVDLADFTAPVTLAQGGAKHRKGVHSEQLSCVRVEI